MHTHTHTLMSVSGVRRTTQIQHGFTLYGVVGFPVDGWGVDGFTQTANMRTDSRQE